MRYIKCILISDIFGVNGVVFIGLKKHWDADVKYIHLLILYLHCADTLNSISVYWGLHYARTVLGFTE